MTCDDNILDALGSLGTSADLTQEENSQLLRFVCQLYKSKSHNNVNGLRWFLYSNRAAEGEGLHPTIGSLKPHIQRANYIAMI